MTHKLQYDFETLRPLSELELSNVNGGETFWYWVGWAFGITVGSAVAVGTASAQYQASLPPNLKK